MTNIEELMQASREALDDLNNDEDFQRQVKELNELIEEENRRIVFRLIHGIYDAINNVPK